MPAAKERRSHETKPPTQTMQRITTMDSSQRKILRWFSFPLFTLGLLVLTLFILHGGLEGHDLKGIALELGMAGAFVVSAILLVAKPQEFAAALLALMEKLTPERFLKRTDRRN